MHIAQISIFTCIQVTDATSSEYKIRAHADMYMYIHDCTCTHTLPVDGGGERVGESKATDTPGRQRLRGHY